MNTPKKDTSMGKDIAVIIAILIVLLSLVVGLIYGVVCLVRSSLKSDVRTKKEMTSAPAIPQRQPVSKSVEQPKKEPPLAAARPTVAPAPAPVKEGPALDLGRDMAVLRDLVEVQVNGFDLKQAKLTFRKAKKDVQILIPVGLRLTPKSATNVCTYVVSESRTLNVSAAGSESVVYVPVAGVDFHYLHGPANGVDFEVTIPCEPNPVSEFLAFAAAKTSSWNTAQTGVWVLENNISRQELTPFRLAYPDTSAPGGIRQEPLASYADIKNVEAILSALGKDPDSYKLIVEERQERNRLINQMNFEKPSSSFLSILRGKNLVRYAGDSEAERLLCQYMTQHRRYDVRRSALDNLLALGLIGSPDEIFRKRIWDNDVNMRLVVGTTLARAGDPRGLPLLAVCADDPILSDVCATSTEAAIQKKSGQARNPNESMLAYWTRVIGWDGLGGPGGRDVDTLRRVLEAASPKADAALTQALADIVSADEAKASAACYTLARYSRNQKAFDALCRTVLQPRAAELRDRALSSLRSFRDFSPAKMCEQIVKQEEERFIYNVLNMISSVQFNGFENTLLLAARHSSPSVRRQAVELLGNARVTEAEKELVKMAQYDSDFGVKESALYALSIMKSQEGLNLCQSLLRSGDRNNKYKAWRCLAAWEDDSDAVELMQKYKNDPDVGQQIKAHLGRYGK